ncbi:hypothetical protein TVAG_193440 [Trichomonas vaginalis G3]|uniref:VPS9 domain-containing protein n=1 Tax=Trichomonas vaginalis (strain ATCC PRA-98 / G3) TaxID=412133 RepID=A2DH58_TRIV3|nr:VPS9 domain family [Trichomonas vaginalis G3]EAY20368.1 hypothetical protein TVAG_193440 [Trichomonas vaginalis G3]KAI5530632.1 VPS9 domain family [Trichomonas vaginalis G3]|eukprot:XP_001581354.1 hypothetical protein [Trichomonas vaginalis G3]
MADILFNDTSSVKKKKSGLAGKSTGFSKSKVESNPALNLFGNDDLFASKPKEKKDDLFGPTLKRDSSKDVLNTKKTEKPNELVENFLKSHPALQEFVRLSPIAEFGLTQEQIQEKIQQSAQNDFARFKNITPILFGQQTRVDTLIEKINKKYANQKVPFGASLNRRGLHSLTYTLRVDRVELCRDNIDRVSEILQFIGHLINIFSSSTVTQELRIDINGLEQAITNFEETNPEYIKMSRIIHQVDKEVKKTETIDSSWPTIRNIVGKLFNPQTGYFPDLGTAESLFEIFVQSFPTEIKQKLDKLIDLSISHPNAIGKAILTQSKEVMKYYDIDSDQNLQYMFILFARYFFSQIYQSTIGPNILSADISTFTARIVSLRKLSPIGFGFSGNFLPENLKGLTLESFPADNPYKEAIGCFELIQFQYCPLDFCRAVHEALKTIQSIASEISFEIKTNANNGKIYAKSDHLLCLDDLFDISLIVLVLAAPVSLKAMVEQFEPYIESLEMTAELEFAFTNISAMVKHIMEMDISNFMNAAKERTNQFVDIDPLRIMS